MMFFKPHFSCAWSLQVVAPEQVSKHHADLALCPVCDHMTFIASEEETLAELVEERVQAKSQLARATETLELFRQRVAQRRSVGW